MITSDGIYTIRIVAEEGVNSDGLKPIEATLHDVIIEDRNSPSPIPPAASGKTGFMDTGESFNLTIRDMLSGVKDDMKRSNRVGLRRKPPRQLRCHPSTEGN